MISYFVLVFVFYGALQTSNAGDPSSAYADNLSNSDCLNYALAQRMYLDDLTLEGALPEVKYVRYEKNLPNKNFTKF